MREFPKSTSTLKELEASARLLEQATVNQQRIQDMSLDSHSTMNINRVEQNTKNKMVSYPNEY